MASMSPTSTLRSWQMSFNRENKATLSCRLDGGTGTSRAADSKQKGPYSAPLPLTCTATSVALLLSGPLPHHRARPPFPSPSHQPQRTGCAGPDASSTAVVPFTMPYSTAARMTMLASVTASCFALTGAG